jgi:hypothetical protein
VRKIVAAPLLALALLIPAATPALAHGNASGSEQAGHSSSDDNGKRTDDGTNRSKHDKPVRSLFTSAGPVTAVDTTADTITYTVRGGANKALRGTSVTVAITAITVLTRNDDEATVDDIQVGDHVAIRGLNRGALSVAFRVEADGPDGPVVTPTPAPTVSAT